MRKSFRRLRQSFRTIVPKMGTNEEETSTKILDISEFESMSCYEFPAESNQSDRIEALKCIKKALAAFHEGQYVKAERFILKSLRICKSERAESFLETVQKAPKAQTVENHNDLVNNRLNVKNYELKITTEETNQLNLKVTEEFDEVDNLTPNRNLESISETAQQCIDTAQSALDEGNCEKAYRLLAKAVRISPTDISKNLMKEVEEKLLESGVNPDEVLKGIKKNTVNKDSNDSSPPPKTKELPNKYITEVRRVEKANDDYDILGIPKGSTLGEVDKAYRSLTKLLHPDKNNDPGAEEAYMKVKEARNRLKPKRSK